MNNSLFQKSLLLESHQALFPTEFGGTIPALDRAISFLAGTSSRTEMWGHQATRGSSDIERVGRTLGSGRWCHNRLSSADENWQSDSLALWDVGAPPLGSSSSNRKKRFLPLNNIWTKRQVCYLFGFTNFDIYYVDKQRQRFILNFLFNILEWR